MSSSSSIIKILFRYKQREELSNEELAELRLWMMESPKNEKLFDELSKTEKWDRETAKWNQKDPETTWNKISKRVKSISPEAFKRKNKYKRFLIAASVAIVLFSAAGYFWNKQKPVATTPEIVRTPKALEIQPAAGSALLTLSNGGVMILDSLSKGMQTIQENTTILKTDSEALSYNTKSAKGEIEKYNVLSTAKGRQYHVVLSDGTKVWLNATSSLRFPVAFTGNNRYVELTGEGYFEVAKDRSKPFIVETGNAITIRVTGTHFNVNAYSDNPMMTVSLQEGSVMVSNKKDSNLLRPGEQAEVNQVKVAISPADMDQVMAWRKKLFWFKHDSFERVMRTLSRWYDMDVVYKGEIKESYTGILPDNLPLSNVLNILEKGGNVHFTIEEGNKVLVRP